jgi:Protein of unknown function (DUF998)
VPLSPPRRCLAPALVALAGLTVLTTTHYFASLRPGYSHVANTISELGETGSVHERALAFGFWLPVGLMVWLGLWLAHREMADREASLVLLAFSCLGLGYVGGAFFPCDPGAPIFGTWRTLAHNLAGFIDFEGTGIGFLLASRYFARRQAPVPTISFLVAGGVVLICVVLMTLEATWLIRGAVQRVLEAIQYGGVSFACLLLLKQAAPARSPRSESPVTLPASQ